jgi:hypothetical protein
MSIDLDINNYNFSELLNIFKINNFECSNENTQKIKKYCSLIKKNYSNDIYKLYFKASKIIDCIYKLINSNIINSDNTNHYVNEIKKIKSFEKYDTTELIQNYLNINIINQDKEIPTFDKFNNFEEVDYNLSNKVNPVLNDKNNTNIIIDSFPNSAAPGKLNSIKRITHCQNLNLNSCFRNNYYTCSSTDFQYLLPSEIKNVISLRLASIEIPNAWYLFSHKQNNNIFKIIINADDIITNYSIVIPDGNYDNESLTHFLNTTYFCDSELESSLKYIRFSIDTKNFKTRFEILDEYSFKKYSFSLVFFQDINENLMNTAGWILGFRLANYSNIYENIQSEGLFDGSGDKYVYLSLNDYQYNNNSSNIVGFDKSFMEEGILAKIPMINGKLSLIIDDNNNPLTKTRKYNGPVTIKKLHIKVLDKFGAIIDLNNMDFSFTIEVELLYESFNFKNVGY